MTNGVKKYMRAVARFHCEDFSTSDYEEHESYMAELARDSAWDELTIEEQGIANQLVMDIFEEFL